MNEEQLMDELEAFVLESLTGRSVEEIKERFDYPGLERVGRMMAMGKLRTEYDPYRIFVKREAQRANTG